MYQLHVLYIYIHRVDLPLCIMLLKVVMFY